MNRVKPKKHLGQHFLIDKTIARKISDSLTGVGYSSVLEVGPGMGILTDFLILRGFQDFRIIEIDSESVDYLKIRYPEFKNIIKGDFLTFDINKHFDDKLALIGNFPYNISSQILFKALDNRDKIIEICGMLQKEVAERICSSPGSKKYGILSVFLQTFYNTEYLFSVPNNLFSPPPDVMSGVIRLQRNSTSKLNCDENLYFRVVKACFNQRRKILKNSVKASFRLRRYDHHLLSQRPEQLSVEQFIDLTGWIAENLIPSE